MAAFSRINSGTTTHAFHDTATLRIKNTDSSATLNVTDLILSNSATFSLPNGETSLTIAPNEHYDLDVEFIESSGSKGIRRATLTLFSDASNEQSTVVQLAGAYMAQPEGGNEVTATQIARAFSYTTDLDEPLTEENDSPLAGDEVRSAFWQRADSSEPVYVRQLAAFHGCCSAEDSISISGSGGGSFSHEGIYGQSLLPLKNNSSEPAEMTINPSSQFAINIAGYSTNTSGNLGVRTWPIFDRDGELVEDAYFVIQDFVQNGCGSGSANCDYNDNVYLITNIEPAP